MVANTHDGQQPTLRRSNPGHLDMIVVSARYHASCRRAFHLASPSVSDGHVRRRRGSLASMLASPSRFLTQIMRRHAPFFRISVDRALKASGVRIRVDGGACEIVRLRHCDAPSPRRHTPAIVCSPPPDAAQLKHDGVEAATGLASMGGQLACSCLLVSNLLEKNS